MIISVLPFYQLNRVVFRRDSAVQFCWAGNASLPVADRDGYVEATVVVGGGAYTMLAINYDAVLFQTHVVQKIQLLH